MLNTTHNVINRIEANLWLFSLSVAFAKAINTHIVLHTDNIGKKIFGFLPYDEIYLTLNCLNNTPACFWAAGKIEAQSFEPLSSIHIDGDVFLKKNLVLEKLQFDKYDLLVQNKEFQSAIYKNHLEEFHEIFSNQNLPKELNTHLTCAYNCGIIGFNNPEIKHQYIEGYKQLMNLCIENNKFMMKHLNNQLFTPDLIIEQWWLYNVSENHTSNVKLLFDNMNTLQEDAIRIGYVHLLGNAKYTLINKVKDRLWEVNPNLYNETEHQIKKLIANKIS